MNRFAFHPELFDVRSTAMETLARHGIEWFTDYTSIDLEHDLVGIEVIGIRDEKTSRQIHEILKRILHDMKHDYFLLDDENSGGSYRVHFSKYADWGAT